MVHGDGAANQGHGVVVLNPMQAVEVVLANKQFRDDFASWLLDNWNIWLAFERRANRLWSAGSRHAGARMIGETLRYLTALREKGSQWKINDWWWPDMARLYMLLHPDRKGFFETRGRFEKTPEPSRREVDGGFCSTGDRHGLEEEGAPGAEGRRQEEGLLTGRAGVRG